MQTPVGRPAGLSDQHARPPAGKGDTEGARLGALASADEIPPALSSTYFQTAVVRRHFVLDGAFCCLSYIRGQDQLQFLTLEPFLKTLAKPLRSFVYLGY